MAFGTLFTKVDNPRATAIKAVAKANNLELNIVEANTGAPSVEHLKAHGLGKVPAFLGEDGFALSECIAIAIYSTFAPFELYLPLSFSLAAILMIQFVIPGLNCHLCNVNCVDNVNI